MQPIGRGEVARLEITTPNRPTILADRTDITFDDANPDCRGGTVQGVRERGTPHTQTLARAEVRPDRVSGIQIGDTAKGLTVQGDAELLQMLDRMRHQALAAGLVDRAASAFDDDGLQPGLCGIDGGGQPTGAATGDEKVDHANLAKAAFSVVIRLVNRAALRTVKTRAVIHAVWTSGRAMPSATTAT